MITIGVDLGGPELRDSPIDKALMKAMGAAIALRSANYNDGTTAWINSIFIVPGSVSPSNFQGYKLGRFSRKRKGLAVMIAVPVEVADGPDIAQFVGAALRQAVQLAAAHFSSKQIGFSVLEAERLITAIETAITT